jgi:YD repeat-containing protein
MILSKKNITYQNGLVSRVDVEEYNDDGRKIVDERYGYEYSDEGELKAASMRRIEYEYDEIGRITKMDSFDYDGADDNSLVPVSRDVYKYTYIGSSENAANEERISYGADGNVVGSRVIEREFDKLDRPSKQTTRLYDAAGELTGYEIRTYVYDAEGYVISEQITEYDAEGNVIDERTEKYD